MPSIKGKDLAAKLFLLFFSLVSVAAVISSDAFVHDVLIIKLAEERLPGKESQEPISIRMSPGLRKKAECKLDAAEHPSVDYECPGAVPKGLFKYYQSPVRVIGRSLDAKTGIKKLLDLCSAIKNTYDGSVEKKLGAIVIILPTNLVALFDMFLGDLNAPVVLVDTTKIFHEMLGDQVDRRRFYLNPSTDLLRSSLTRISDRSQHKLRHIFLSDPKDILFSTSDSQFFMHKLTDLMDSLDSGDKTDRTELFASSLNGLVAFKCSQQEINGFLFRISQLELETRPFKVVNDSAFKRTLVWIPQDENSSASPLQFQNFFQVQVLQWQIDVDKIVENVIERRIARNEELKAFTEASEYSLTSTVGVGSALTRRPNYRIILQPTEPFLIASDFSENDRDDLTSADSNECKDGLVCFELDADAYEAHNQTQYSQFRKGNFS